MALPAQNDTSEWVTLLSTEHDAEKPQLRELDDEYEGRTAMRYMHPEIERELGDRLSQVILAWPELVTGAIEERLDVEGFGLPDADGGDEELWRVWQANNCDEESSLAHLDALALRRSYICVGPDEDDETTPIITYESPLEVYAKIDTRTGRTLAALRRWSDGGGDAITLATEYATLYLPDMTVHFEGGTEVDRDEHGLGEVPVVPMVNRSRLANRRGRSELEPVLPLSRAANKILTDMMVAAEFVALPLRGIFGVGPEDFQDEQGNRMSALQVILGRLLAIPVTDASQAKEFEFAGAQLSNFHSTVDMLARLVASLTGLPPSMVGLHSDQPASADAIRANEARLVKRAERKQRAFGGAHERAARLVRRLQAGDWDPKLRQLETKWRNAATPTVAQSSDAAVKLHAEGIISTRQARLDLGYTLPQIARMEAEDAAAADRALGLKPALVVPATPPEPVPVP